MVTFNVSIYLTDQFTPKIHALSNRAERWHSTPTMYTYVHVCQTMLETAKSIQRYIAIYLVQTNIVPSLHVGPPLLANAR